MVPFREGAREEREGEVGEQVARSRRCDVIRVILDVYCVEG